MTPSTPLQGTAADAAARRTLVVGNWKMHGDLQANRSLLQALVAAPRRAGCEIGVCVPFPYLAQARELLAGSAIALGAQDCSTHQQGAYTGEVSARMLREFDCRYVLVGHSERRALHGETDPMVAAKAERALDCGITPIVCVGETGAQREAGETDAVIGMQIDAVLHLLGSHASRMVLAYEPVWAIGSGRSASAAQAQQVHALIRSRAVHHGVDPRELTILYGGSVNPGNAGELFGQDAIDGGLIGGASLKAADFLAIVAAAPALSPTA